MKSADEITHMFSIYCYNTNLDCENFESICAIPRWLFDGEFVWYH